MNYPTDPYEAGHAQGDRTGRSDVLHALSQPVGKLTAWCELYDEGVIGADAAMAKVADVLGELATILHAPTHKRETTHD